MKNLENPFKRKIFIVGLCYTDVKLELMISRVTQACERIFGIPNTETIVVDNSYYGDTKIHHNYHYISGDNTCFEFSGWASGIAYLRQNFLINDTDIIILVNDTIIERSYSLGGKDFLLGYSFDIDLSLLPECFAAGYYDDFPEQVMINQIIFKRWIRSNFIILSFQALKAVEPLVFPFDNEVIFSNTDSFWADTHFISRNWQAYISCWLFGKEDTNFPEYRLKWLKHEHLTGANNEFFKVKAKCILSEHYLSARLDKFNIQTFDFNKYYKSSDRHLTPYYS